MTNDLKLKAVAVPLFTPSPDLVRVANSVVEAINDGELVGIAGVALYRDGTTRSFHGGEQGTATLGRLDMLKAFLIEELSR